jgi:hypothetical protein
MICGHVWNSPRNRSNLKVSFWRWHEIAITHLSAILAALEQNSLVELDRQKVRAIV